MWRDLWICAGLTEIGQANAMPMRQFRTNQRPIDTPFWIGNFSSIRENWGQSYAMQEPIQRQSWLSQTDNLLPIQCQSVTSQLPIQCRWLANPVTILCQSLPNPVPIWCQSVSISHFNAVTIHHQSIALLIHGQSEFSANPVPIWGQSKAAYHTPIHFQSYSNLRIKCQFTNPMPI